MLENRDGYWYFGGNKLEESEQTIVQMGYEQGCNEGYAYGLEEAADKVKLTLQQLDLDALYALTGRNRAHAEG